MSTEAHPARIGRYEIQKPLGSGAMGDVFLAHDPNIGRLVAIKTVRVIGGNEEDIADRRGRLLREARAAGKFVHPNVVALYDAGEADGLLYLAFEYVPGQDLLKRARQAPEMSLREVLRVVRETASALDYAQSENVVHRDIKPSNILLGPKGVAKVADFGIAKLHDQSVELTRTGSVVGSPQYMSPEQIRGEDLDGRSDIFSLGVVFYELLSRTRPFGGDTISTLVFEILAKEPPPIESLRPGLPPALVQLVRSMMVKDRQHRVADAGKVVEAIQALERQIAAAELDAPASQATGADSLPTQLMGSGPQAGGALSPGYQSGPLSAGAAAVPYPTGPQPPLPFAASSPSAPVGGVPMGPPLPSGPLQALPPAAQQTGAPQTGAPSYGYAPPPAAPSWNAPPPPPQMAPPPMPAPAFPPHQGPPGGQQQYQQHPQQQQQHPQQQHYQQHPQQPAYGAQPPRQAHPTAKPTSPLKLVMLLGCLGVLGLAAIFGLFVFLGDDAPTTTATTPTSATPDAPPPEPDGPVEIPGETVEPGPAEAPLDNQATFQPTTPGPTWSEPSPTTGGDTEPAPVPAPEPPRRPAPAAPTTSANPGGGALARLGEAIGGEESGGDESGEEAGGYDAEPAPRRRPEPPAQNGPWDDAAAKARSEMETGLRFQFKVTPPEAQVLFWSRGDRAIVQGAADQFDPKHDEDARVLELPGDGEYLLVIRHSGVSDYVIKVKADGSRGNRPRLVQVNLARPGGGSTSSGTIKVSKAISFAGSPGDAYVFVDGRASGRASDYPGGEKRNSDENLKLSRGKHVVRLEAPGFKPYEIRVEVASGAPAVEQINFRLEKE